jgi:hypothetical protein
MLQWAAELQHFGSDSDWLAEAQQLLTTVLAPAYQAMPATDRGSVPGMNLLLLGEASAAAACFSSFESAPPAMQQLLSSMQAYLTPGSKLASGLSAAGYDVQAVLSSIAAAATALEAARSSICSTITADGGAGGSDGGGDSSVAGGGDDDRSSALDSQHALVQLTVSLQQLGLILAKFAVPYCCNNPSCRTVSGPTEQSTVGGRSCICAGCLTARYCGRGCQRLHWKQHKPVCKELAARGAAAPAAAAAKAEAGGAAGGL